MGRRTDKPPTWWERLWSKAPSPAPPAPQAPAAPPPGSGTAARKRQLVSLDRKLQVLRNLQAICSREPRPDYNPDELLLKLTVGVEGDAAWVKAMTYKPQAGLRHKLQGPAYEKARNALLGDPVDFVWKYDRLADLDASALFWSWLGGFEAHPSRGAEALALDADPDRFRRVMALAEHLVPEIARIRHAAVEPQPLHGFGAWGPPPSAHQWLVEAGDNAIAQWDAAPGNEGMALAPAWHRVKNVHPDQAATWLADLWDHHHDVDPSLTGERNLFRDWIQLRALGAWIDTLPSPGSMFYKVSALPGDVTVTGTDHDRRAEEIAHGRVMSHRARMGEDGAPRSIAVFFETPDEPELDQWDERARIGEWRKGQCRCGTANPRHFECSESKVWLKLTDSERMKGLIRRSHINTRRSRCTGCGRTLTLWLPTIFEPVHPPRRSPQPSGLPECRSCNADWTSGAWTWGCQECGGGSLQLACTRCMGRCGAVWSRDWSHQGEAEWYGTCHQPQLAISIDEATRLSDGLRNPEAADLVGEVREALKVFSSDEAWRRQPEGPEILVILADWLMGKCAFPLRGRWLATQVVLETGLTR